MFTAYVQWLYTHQIDTASFDLREWATSYVLGEQLMDRDFQNAVMCTIYPKLTSARFGNSKSSSLRGLINILYEGTLVGSSARKSMADFVDNVHQPFEYVFAAWKTGMHEDFLPDLQKGRELRVEYT
jgi:hypothetical protein